jgi:hypothetical protein
MLRKSTVVLVFPYQFGITAFSLLYFSLDGSATSVQFDVRYFKNLSISANLDAISAVSEINSSLWFAKSSCECASAGNSDYQSRVLNKWLWYIGIWK